VLDRLAADIQAALGEDLVSLAVHGSWVFGDFRPGRSDLDLLAVLATDPTATLLTQLSEVHAGVERDYPDWAGHIEVDYLSSSAVADIVRGVARSHPMIRISPGDAIHMLTASRHYALNWAAAIAANHSAAGAPPAAVLPVIGDRLVEEVLLDHVRAWPRWVLDVGSVGGQVYAVLALCRAAATLVERRQLSKRAAAAVGTKLFPDWADLIDWACRWWYDGGSDTAPGRREEVRQFVEYTTERILVTTAADLGAPQMLPHPRQRP
jgi:Domain of unknown function (DUF4111)